MNISISLRRVLAVFGVAATLAVAAVRVHADEAAALEARIQKAEQGDVASQVILGKAYFTGENAPRDFVKAAHWFGKASQKGDRDALRTVAWVYYIGAGVPRDYAAAVGAIPKNTAAFVGMEYFVPANWPEALGNPGGLYWEAAIKEIVVTETGPANGPGGLHGDEFVKGNEGEVERIAQLAEQGNASAQYVLGQLCARGVGVPKDMAKAMEWLTKAATGGNAQAQVAVGGMYADGGAGVTKDEAKAHEWFVKSAAQGNNWGEFALGASYRAGEGVEKDPAKAAEWLGKSAAQGNIGAQMTLAMMYRDGDGVPKDAAKAKAFFASAAEQGNEPAMEELQKLDPSMTPETVQQGRKFKEVIRAADKGEAMAQWALGVAYSTKGPTFDPAKAIHYYTLAADQGNEIAQFSLGLMYFNGDGVPKDYGRAAQWFTKVAETGDITAQIQVGELYEAGQGVPQDNVKAYMWYNISSATGGSKGIEHRDAIEKKMKPEEIAQAQKASSEWMDNHRKAQSKTN